MKKFFFCIIFIAGCASPQFKAGNTYFKQGSDKLQSRQCGSAVEDFTKAINNYSMVQDPVEAPISKLQIAGTYSQRSACHKQLGKLDLALEDQKKAVGIYREICQSGSQRFSGMAQAITQEQACKKIPEQELALENLIKETPQPEAAPNQEMGTRSTLQDILKELQKEE